MAQLTPTDLAAWWGALTASLVLVWDVYKWNASNRPRIHLEVKPNTEIMNSPIHAGHTYISVRAYNRSDRATTITNFGGEWYRSRVHRLIRRGGQPFVVASPGFHPLPHQLEPGTVWDGIILQDKSLEDLARTGILVCLLFCSHSEGPISRRIVGIKHAKGKI